MTQAVRIILLEDLLSDAEIIQRELKKASFPVEIKWVQTSEQYRVALFSFAADIVISDHSLRGFTSIDAFKWLKESGLDIPFVLVTATVSEDFAVMMMKAGVADYLLKDRLQRLPLAVTNALEKWRFEKEKQVSVDLLKKSEKHLSAILENSSVSIYSIDRQFRYIAFNSFLRDSVKRAYGLEIKVGDPVFEFLKLYDAEELPQWEKVYTEAFAGSRIEFEKEFHIGEYYACVSFSINPIVEGDHVTGLSCFGWDITTQKLAAKKLRQSEARFRALIENNYDAIIMRDGNKRVSYSSPSVKRLLGYSFEETFDAPYQDLIHPDDLGLVNQVYKKMMQHPGVPFPLTMRVRRKDGTYLWSEGVMTNMLDNSNVNGFVSNFRDITERKESELQREKMTLDLIERNQNLEQYTFIVSHNLRAPVANILGISNLLEMKGVAETDKELALQHLFASARRLDEVIKDLNLVLQLRQSINEQKENVGFEELVADVLQNISDLVMKSKVQVKTDFGQVRSIATVNAYLYSIFYNLITNAIKYTRDGATPVIRITSENAGDRVRLKFADNGLGIDLESHGSKLFGLYQRFHHEHAEGKGLGLFMTKIQVEALGGRMSVESDVGVGTTFTIDL